MSKRIVNEQLRYEIIINGDSAQSELVKLDKQTRDLQKSNKDLNKERMKLIAAGKRGSEEYKNLTAEITKNSETIRDNEERMRKLRAEVGVNNLSMAQLRKRATELRTALNHMIPGTENHTRYKAELDQINARIRELNRGSHQAKFSIAKLADGFNKYMTMATAVIAVVTGVVLSINNLIEGSYKLADAQSDVAKTTGLNKQAIGELTRDFDKFNTRTPRLELLKLAEEAGRLGKDTKKDVLEFVKVANQLKVALGDDLSEEQIREVGKLTEIYRVGEQTGRNFGEAMLSLGSAINEVSASGANTAGFLVDFMKRTAGIAVQAKLGAADNVAYAATFDEIGQTAEVSGTVMNKVWIDMFKNTAVYANIAGVRLSKFSEILNKDSNFAMKLFLKGLNGNNEGLATMSTKLEDVEGGGARGAAALAALANNLELLEKRQKISYFALKDATSLTDEYNVKNNNLAANIDKIGRKIRGAFINSSLVSWLGEVADAMAIWLRDTELEALENQAAHIRTIEIELHDLNTTSERRVELINEMQELFPEYFKNLDAEKSKENEIKEAIALANAEMARRIVLQEHQEKINENNLKQQDRMVTAEKLKLQMMELTSKLAAENNINISYANDAREAAQIVASSGNLFETLFGEYGKLSRIANGYDIAINAVNARTKINNQLTEEQIELYRKLGYTVSNGNVYSMDQLRSAEDEYRKSLEKTNEVTEEQRQYKFLSQDEIDAIKKKNEELKKAREKFFEDLKNLRREFNISQMDSDRAEMARLNDKYDKMRKEAKDLNVDLKYINSLYFQEKEALERTQLEKSRAELKKFAKEGRKQTLFEQYLEELFYLSDHYNNKKGLEEEFQEALAALKNKYAILRENEEKEKQEKLREIRERYGLITNEKQLEIELGILQGVYDKQLISHEEFLIAKKNLEEKYSKKSLTDEERKEEEAKRMKLNYAANIAQLGGRYVMNMMNDELAQYQNLVQGKYESDLEFERRKEESEARIKEIRKKYADIEFGIRLAEIIADTAAAVMMINKQLGIAAPAVIPFIIGQGIAQGIVVNQERKRVQGFESGLYPVIDQMGRPFDAQVMPSGTMEVPRPTVLVGEKPEMVIDPFTFRDLKFNAPEIIQGIYAARARAHGYESGLYPSTQKTPEAGSDASFAQIMAMIALNTQAIGELRDVLHDGIVAKIPDRTVRDLKERQDRFDSIKNKSRLSS